MLHIEHKMDTETFVAKRNLLAVVSEGGVLVELSHLQLDGISPSRVAILSVEAHCVLVVLGDLETTLVARC